MHTATAEETAELCEAIVNRIELEDAPWGIATRLTPHRVAKAILQFEHLRMRNNLPVHSLDVVHATFWAMVPQDQR